MDESQNGEVATAMGMLHRRQQVSQLFKSLVVAYAEESGAVADAAAARRADRCLTRWSGRGGPLHTVTMGPGYLSRRLRLPQAP